MSENPAIKDLFNHEVVAELAARLASVQPGSATDAFIEAACNGLEELELKQRVRHIAQALAAHLPEDFPQAAHIIRKMVAGESALRPLAVWPLNQVVQANGLDHFEEAMVTLYELTKIMSSEFAIRPFLQRYPDAARERLEVWAGDPHPGVRRLVCEGTRPRLPWAPRLSGPFAEPAMTLPLLKRLRDDPDEAVRRSVANHLNDISKTDPEWVTTLLAEWAVGASHQRRKLIHHALRTLIKKGDTKALAIVGIGEAQARLVRFEVRPAVVELGGRVEIVVELVSEAATDQELLIDYAVFHRTARGDLSRKVFKWTRRTVAAGAALHLSKRHQLVSMSTRRYYPGEHRVELLVNGSSMATVSFELRAGS